MAALTRELRWGVHAEVNSCLVDAGIGGGTKIMCIELEEKVNEECLDKLKAIAKDQTRTLASHVVSESFASCNGNFSFKMGASSL